MSLGRSVGAAAPSREGGAAAPSREDFRALARGCTVVPVWREVVADLGTPVAAFLRLVGGGEGFILESVERERWGRWSFVGRNSPGRIVARNGRIEATGVCTGVAVDQGLLHATQQLLNRFRGPELAELPPLHSGLVGWLGYDTVREIEHLPCAPSDDRDLPDGAMAVIGDLAAFDHWRQRVTLIHNAILDPMADGEAVDQAYDEALTALDSLCADGATPIDEPVLVPPPENLSPAESSRTVTSDRFQDGVRAAQSQILEGEIFEVVLSQRFDLDLEAEPFDVYRSLRQLNPSPYMYFLRDPELVLAGSSPETHVRLRAGQVMTRPIAGTRHRGRDDDHDRRLAGELLESPKERAEHLMLVDLARNDLGRIAVPGSVRVEELMQLERFSHVMHMTSQVSADLVEGLGPVDVLRATFPAGTVSGAPKVRAMELIDELEVTRRGPYGGVVGYMDFSGNMDTAITLRTLVARGDRGWVQAGAGVVADSDPADEDLECSNKAAAVLAAVAAARGMRDASI